MSDETRNVHSYSTDEPDAFTTIRAVRDAHRVTGAKRAVLYALAMSADGKTGRNARPSTATLADRSGLSVRTVDRALVDLEAEGLIHHTGDWRAGRGRPVKVWALDLAALSGKPVTVACLDEANPSRSQTNPSESRMTSHDLSTTRNETKAAEDDGAPRTTMPAAIADLSDDMRKWAAEKAPNTDLAAAHADWLVRNTGTLRADWLGWWRTFILRAQHDGFHRLQLATAVPKSGKKRARRGYDDVATWGKPEDDPVHVPTTDAELDAIFGARRTDRPRKREEVVHTPELLPKRPRGTQIKPKYPRRRNDIDWDAAETRVHALADAMGRNAPA